MYSLRKDLKPLAGGRDKDGYRKVILCRKGVRRYVRVHMLVLEVFKGPRPDGMEAAHENNIRDDNRPDNLRWDTTKGNHADKKKHGTHQAGEKHAQVKLTDVLVRKARKMHAEEGFTLAAIAAQMGVCVATISHIVTRRNWRHID